MTYLHKPFLQFAHNKSAAEFTRLCRFFPAIFGRRKFLGIDKQRFRKMEINYPAREKRYNGMTEVLLENKYHLVK